MAVPGHFVLQRLDYPDFIGCLKDAEQGAAEGATFIQAGNTGEARNLAIPGLGDQPSRTIFSTNA